MPNIQVRDVPDEVHERLVRRSERAGQSLQQYLAGQLADIAATPTLEDVLDRVEERPKGRLTPKEAIDSIDAERARR
jgi:antitoxin FitA